MQRDKQTRERRPILPSAVLRPANPALKEDVKHPLVGPAYFTSEGILSRKTRIGDVTSAAAKLGLGPQVPAAKPKT
eukprot:8717161-Pyramimonas_sp.AAC.1